MQQNNDNCQETFEWKVKISKKLADLINKFIETNNLTNAEFLTTICTNYVNSKYNHKRRVRLYDLVRKNKYGKRKAYIDEKYQRR